MANGTGKKFDVSHNADWHRHAGPIVEAYHHCRYFLSMAVKHGETLDAPPEILPSGWAAILHLYGLR